MFTSSFSVYCRLQLARWRKYGFLWLIRRIFYTLFKWGVGFFLQPFAFIAHLFGYRRVHVATKNIGHLACEPDCLLKLLQLHLLPKKRYFISTTLEQVANPCLLEYWQKHISIVTHPVLHHLLLAASAYGLMKLDITDFVTTETAAARYYEVNLLWGNQPPLLSLSEADRLKGLETLCRLGLPAGAWYVCLHVREGGYAPECETVHHYRNADIHNYHKAIQTIASHGGWVIRVGDPTMQKMPLWSNVIDYAHSIEKSDWMDLFLCADCRFFLGNTSGLFFVSTIFGVPSVLVNIAPFSAKAFAPGDVYIPKHLRDKKSGQYLSFSQILKSPIANFRDSQLYLSAGVEVVENSSEDIHEVVQEAIWRRENRWKPCSGDEARQKLFNELFQRHHYGHKSPARIGSSFLAKYGHLLS